MIRRGCLTLCKLITGEPKISPSLPCIARRGFMLGRQLQTTDQSPAKSVRLKNAPVDPLCSCDSPGELRRCSKSDKCQSRVNQVPVYIKTYGCQMNVNDTNIIISILQEFGYRMVDSEAEAEIQLLMTCAIRESAESKVWAKLNHLKFRKGDSRYPLKQIGLLGCMAERLKDKVLQASDWVDIIAGPDAYRDLPRLFAVNRMGGEKAINCLLSFDETYSDIRPVTNLNDVTAFVSITRGCDNLCSYCVVPFTRGRERSRPITTILDEVRTLMDRGIREVTLLGQNVNSYRDTRTLPETLARPGLIETVADKEGFAPGFKTVYKPRTKGIGFAVLLEEVAKISPELRVRFTSPHPKDFTQDVIDVISRYPNISRCIHLPLQSGSSKVLERMRRGYSSEAFLGLVDRMRSSIPGLALTTDIICGFSGETEQDHRMTIEVMEKVKFNFVYSFLYSVREKTHAYHNFEDDVPADVKARRTREVNDLFRQQATQLNGRFVGSKQLALIESIGRRNDNNLVGRIDAGIKVVIPRVHVKSLVEQIDRDVRPGDYVACEITESNSQTLRARPLYITSQAQYHHIEESNDRQASESRVQ